MTHGPIPAPFPSICGLLLAASLALPAQDLILTEFMADNKSILKSDFDEYADWIEIHNPGLAPVDLDGWRLTDSAGKPAKWVFPPRSIAAGAYEIVWADSRDRKFSGQPLHTNFALSKGGEYLALIRPDGSIATEFAPQFPAQVTDVSYGFPAPSGSNDGSLPVYFTAPTPGAPNDSGGTVGPAILDHTATLPQPSGEHTDPPAIVTVKVAATTAEIATSGGVRLYFRKMFSAESKVNMRDDGLGADAVAGDGIYSANMPLSNLNPGEMLRWRFEVQDAQGRLSYAPGNPNDSTRDHYYGTVALDPSIETSELPVLHQFLQSPGGADTKTGTEGAVFYLGRFYDNVRFDMHGQSTVAFNKKSHNLRFNKGNYFLATEDAQIKQTGVNLLTNYADKTRFRNTLAWEIARLSGAPWHYAFPVRIQQNAEFLGVKDMVEKGNARMLERNDMNADGALYKMYNSMDTVSGNEKKTRKDENTEDLNSLITNLDLSRTYAQRTTYAYDNVNLPATVNYLAARYLISDRDHGFKNYYLYRDTGRTNEWMPLVWDVDLSFGHMWTPGEAYQNDTLFTDGSIAPIETNRLYRLAAEFPEVRQMYLRRMRTLMDKFLEGERIVNGWMEGRMRDIVASIDPDPDPNSTWTDGDLDFAKWGTWGRGYKPREETEYLIANYLRPRRKFMYARSGSRPNVNSSTIPNTPQSDVEGMVTIDSIDFRPSSGNQNQEYVILRNTLAKEAVDISGWQLTSGPGGMSHTFPGGTVIPSGKGTPAASYVGLLHVAKDAASFRSRALSPKGGQNRYIQGNYAGQLSARGGVVELRNAEGLWIASYPYAGNPTAAQLALRVSEIQYHPLSPTPSELAAMPSLRQSDFEYIELTNISATSLNLANCAFLEGIRYTIPAPATLPQGGRVIIAANPEAFALRYPGVDTPVLGPFEGNLDNAGERLVLVDSVGEVILDFSYQDHWFPTTDGDGRSLVLRDPATPWEEFGAGTSWAISAGPLGSPGEDKSNFAQTYRGWDLFHFSAAELADPQISGPDADPDGDGRPNFAEYALATNPQQADQDLSAFAFTDDKGVRHAGLRFTRPTHALDVIYELHAAEDVGGTWEPVEAQWHQLESSPDGWETGILWETTPATKAQRFFRLLVKQTIPSGIP